MEPRNYKYEAVGNCNSAPPKPPDESAAEEWLKARRRLHTAISALERATTEEVDARNAEQSAWCRLEDEAGRSVPQISKSIDR
jgi:hypothetical protein